MLFKSALIHVCNILSTFLSAGIGRTGTFIAIDVLLQQAEAERQVDVSRQVHQMRLERMKMVQIRVKLK